MKELITVTLIVVGLFEGTLYLERVMYATQRAALRKAGAGLPSLVLTNRALRRRLVNGARTHHTAVRHKKPSDQ